MSKRRGLTFDVDTRTLLLSQPERLVVDGLRCWMAGYEYGDIGCWETAWRVYSNALGTRDARHALSELQYWVRTLRQVTVRPLTCYPYCCRHICLDECLRLSLLSAFQHQDLSGARAAAHQLSGLTACYALELLTEASSSFAGALVEAGQVLHPVPMDLIVADPYWDPQHSALARDWARESA